SFGTSNGAGFGWFALMVIGTDGASILGTPPAGVVEEPAFGGAAATGAPAPPEGDGAAPVGAEASEAAVVAAGSAAGAAAEPAVLVGDPDSKARQAVPPAARTTSQPARPASAVRRRLSTAGRGRPGSK